MYVLAPGIWTVQHGEPIAQEASKQKSLASATEARDFYLFRSPECRAARWITDSQPLPGAHRSLYVYHSAQTPHSEDCRLAAGRHRHGEGHIPLGARAGRRPARRSRMRQRQELASARFLLLCDGGQTTLGFSVDIGSQRPLL